MWGVHKAYAFLSVYFFQADTEANYVVQQMATDMKAIPNKKYYRPHSKFNARKKEP